MIKNISDINDKEKTVEEKLSEIEIRFKKIQNEIIEIKIALIFIWIVFLLLTFH